MGSPRLIGLEGWEFCTQRVFGHGLPFLLLNLPGYLSHWHCAGVNTPLRQHKFNELSDAALALVLLVFVPRALNARPDSRVFGLDMFLKVQVAPVGDGTADRNNT